MTPRLAILGATGLVGRTMLRVLEARDFPVRELRLLGSAGGRTLRFGGRDLPVLPVSERAFDDLDLVLFAVSNELSRQWAVPAQAAGATVIDNSSAFRYEPAVPLVVPEINLDALAGRPTLIANPNCSTAAIVMALAPLVRAARPERVIVSTYQSVSGAGAEALADLERGIRDGLEGAPPPRASGGPAFAYNVVPHIDRFESNAYSREEMKVMWETRKILGLPDLALSATAVRVPVRVGHCASINIVFERAMPPAEARERWARFPGLRVVDDPGAGRYPTPLDAEGRDEVLVGRARSDLSHPRGLEFFIASDNLLKGAALNAVQIAEAVVAEGVRP